MTLMQYIYKERVLIAMAEMYLTQTKTTTTTKNRAIDHRLSVQMLFN